MGIRDPRANVASAEFGALEETIRGKLDRARMELLDLSTRNRLLNTPRRSKTALTVEVVDELASEVFRLLVGEGRAFTFAAGRATRSAASSPDTTADDEDGVASLAQPENDDVDERGVFKRHSDTKLQTPLTSEGLQKRLLNLFFDARTIQEEQGVNILYLALGFLRWFDSPNSDVARFAPLILVPVALERGTAAERFKLRWIQEDPAPNLSLIALMKREHDLLLPEFGEVEGRDELIPSDYFDKVASVVSGKPRWEVLRDDIVLGFFSFAKFLMYRDLDPENWPSESAIDSHELVSALLGDGFEPSERQIGDDEKIDPHFPPANLLHVVDADSSQTVAIEEARLGGNLVIQGPPGTGKSQTIANVIAGAVAEGKSVLFVAEKMAALEVVKRRLDNVGLGDTCLELHSNKARKREVLQELKRTWELGRPNGGEDRTLLRRLETARDALNDHAGRLHQRHEPAGISAYHAIGHLVRLNQQGLPPSDLSLESPERWSREDKARHEQALIGLAERIEDIGIPSRHPWRGTGLDVILRPDLDRFAQRIAAIRGRLSELLNARNELQTVLEMACSDTQGDVERLAAVGTGVSEAPEDLDREAIRDGCWDTRHDAVSDLLEAGSTYAAARESIGGVVAEAAWSLDLGTTRQHLAAYGASWLRWLRGDWRHADTMFKALLSVPPPKTLAERLKVLDQLIAAQKAAADIARDEEIGRRAFGAKWRREKSDWTAIRRIVEWTQRCRRAGIGDEVRKAAGVVDRVTAGRLAGRIRDELPAIVSELERLAADLRLDVSAAFGIASLTSVPLSELLARLDVWLERMEELSKWIAYRVRADQASAAGLRDAVERLANGRLSRSTVIGALDMAYYEAVLRSMIAATPDLGRFDGNGHDRLVQEFRDCDLKRIELARLEVASAHHQRMPTREGAAGPLGVLKGEMARKIGHMPIRQLMRRAGPAIQAIKPVFMMSPLSVAQFLEPGGLGFDLLVIDEASQVQPVDALGALARCGRMIVVGDDRQLPPTQFFAKLTGDRADDDDGDDGTAQVRDIESILGLCTAKGMRNRMLRWHYRSRHQSLIAVSNSQFYENKLFIVPSPFTSEAGIGLRFNLVRDGVYDRGNTAINAVEARTVAEAVIRHAKTHPEQSLGVATFSVKQRRAVLDELELLRRLNPDTEDFFAKVSAEPFFIKNLENIQGDERDVIFISVGYGKDKNGYMAMNFGPLSSEGGERRLNVLISRAKRRCEVFSSITDDDVDLERGKGKGVAAFKLFLHFARTGKMVIGRPADREHDSVFEEQVAAALRAEGYDVHAQVGLAGFFIDLAIADADRPGRYLLGIECDGAAYHSSRSARDRDRLRQAVLEDHGWIIHRIWSTDWFQRPEEQLKRTLAAIAAAKAELVSRDTEAGRSRMCAVPFEIVTVDRGETSEVGLTPAVSKLSIPYREAVIAVPSATPLHEVPAGIMSRLVEQIVEIEGPVHADEIVARIRSLWGLQRAGHRIQAAVARGLVACLQRSALTKDGDFYSVPGGEILVRDRSIAASGTLRKPEMLPPMELRVAVLGVVDSNYGAEREEIITLVSRSLGFKATSAQLRATIDREIDALINDGTLSLAADGIVARPTAPRA